MRLATLFILIGLLLAPLRAGAEPWPLVPTSVHSIMLPRNADAFHEAQRRVARQQGLDIAFLHGGGGVGNGGGGGPPSTCLATGTQYYWSSSQGNDSWDGLSPTNTSGTHGPKASIAAFNAFSLTANQCANFLGGDTFTGCLVAKNGANVSGSSQSSPMYIGVYGAGNVTINSNCPGDQTAAFTIDGVSGIVVGSLAQTFNVEANGTMTQYGYLLINSGGTQSQGVTIYLGDVSGFWTNINTNGSTAAEVYYSGLYGPGGINGINLWGGTLHGASVTSNDDGGIIGTNSNQNILNLSIIGPDIYNLGSLPGGCNGQSNCPGRGEGIVVNGVNGATVKFFRIHDVGANVNAPGGGPSGLECYASNALVAEWGEIFNVRPHNGVYPGQGDDWDGSDMDNGCTNSTFNYLYTHGNGGAGHLNHMGSAGSYGWGKNVHAGYISENDNALGAQIGGGFAAVTFSGQGLASAVAGDYNGTIYQENSGTGGPFAGLGFVGNSTPTAGSLIANDTIVTSTGNVPIVCLNYGGGNLSLASVAFKANGYSAGAFSISGCDSGTVTTLAQWQAVANGGDAGASATPPGFTGTPPFGALSWTPSTQSGSLPGPSGYAPSNAAYINTGFDVGPSGFARLTQDYAGVALPTGTGTGYPIGALVGVPAGGSAPTVSSVTISPSSGLLTASASVAAGNTATVTVTFNTIGMAVTGAPNIQLNQPTGPTVCPFSSVSGANVNFGCTFTSGQNTPIALSAAAPNGNGTFLGTATVGAISLPGGATISASGTNAILNGADNHAFPGLAVNTGGVLFAATNGSDSNACTWAAKCLTPQRIQTVMQGGSAKTAYWMGGTYNSGVSANYVSSGASLQAGFCEGAFTGVINSGTTTYGMLCIASADNGEAMLGYPGQIAIWDGGTSEQNIVFAAAAPTGFTINGLTLNNYSGILTGVTISGITMSNVVANNMRSCSGSTCQENPDWLAMIYSLGQGNIYFAHNVCDNPYGRCYQMTAASGFPYTGKIVVDGNIFINSCQNGDNGDCGPIESTEYTNTLVGYGYQISNNIIESAYNGTYGTKGIYLDGYTGGVTAYGNQVYGTGAYPFMIHGGQLNQFHDNLVDMTGIFAAGWNSQSPALLFYQDNQNACYTSSNGTYCGAMNGNTVENNVVYSTFAPWTTSTCSSYGVCGYPYSVENDGYTIDGPAVSGNLYYATSGSFTHYGSSPSGNAPIITDSSPVTGTGNPVAGTSTGTWGETHYILGAPALALPGMTQFRIDQGAHF